MGIEPGTVGGRTTAPRRVTRDAVGPLVPAALASAGAGLVHAAAIGAHADLTGQVRLFTIAAVVQLTVAVAGLLRPTARGAALALLVVNAGALAFWLLTRTVGIGWVDGLRGGAAPGLADGFAALLAAATIVGATPVLLGRTTVVLPLTGPALAVMALTVPALFATADHDHGHAHGHDHGHDHDHDHDHGHGHDTGSGVALAAGSDHGHDGDHGHDHGSDVALAAGSDQGHDDDHGHSDAHDEQMPAWPRPWDPSGPIDFSGVPGVTPEQQARAEQLVADTLEHLPRFADVTTVGELGFRSIGDAHTGFEHFINIAHIGDEHTLDPRYPESLVYEVDGDDRTLVSAMFIVAGTEVDDPELVEFGGPLMEWHVHDNLCWGIGDDGVPAVKAVTDNHGGTCPPGTVLAGGDNPMVHVWIAPHDCGPFAALEGHGAGQTATGTQRRADQCDHHHSDGHADGHADGHGHGDAVVPPRPYHPDLPIDLGGVDGVTLEQQAFAENLVAVTLRYLPRWADPAVAEAAGFRSIGDGGTGHEHYINWDWIDDDVWLDPTAPEALVYEPQPDGSKLLTAAMYMLPGDMTLEDVPDWGGRLMQWHVHDDLCFTRDPEAPQVAAVVPVGAACPPDLQKMPPAPMIHVWIRPHECGPFAALDGVGAGQVVEGEEHLCNHVHGAP